MKRRVQIAKAFIHDPPLIILDEPTAGVDIELRYQLWDFLKEQNKNGKTILLTTHYIEEAEKFATDNGFMYKEVSVKQSINVDESLLELVEDAYKYKELNKGFKDSDLKYLDLKSKSESNKDREFCCCIC